MLGERELSFPSCLNETSNSAPQHEHCGCLINHWSRYSTVSASASNGRPRFRLLSIIPCRIIFARALRGARATAALRFSSCVAAWRSAYSALRRCPTASAFSSFHARIYALAHGRQTPVNPPRHNLLGLKYSIVEGNSREHFEQHFIARLHHVLWGNETTKFDMEAA